MVMRDHAAYLLDNGRIMVLWLGRTLPPSFFQQVLIVLRPHPYRWYTYRLHTYRLHTYFAHCSDMYIAVLSRLHVDGFTWTALWLPSYFMVCMHTCECSGFVLLLCIARKPFCFNSAALSSAAYVIRPSSGSEGTTRMGS